MSYLRENPLVPGDDPNRKLRALRMLHSLEEGIDVARRLADIGIDSDEDGDRETVMYRILWVLDRISKTAPVISDFVDKHWPDSVPVDA